MKLIHNRLFRLGVSAASLVLVVVLTRSILSVWQKRDIVRQRARELARVETENRQLKKKLVESESPEFIEKEARERLGLVKPGESIVLLPQVSQSGTFEEQTGAPISNWQQWWRLFF